MKTRWTGGGRDNFRANTRHRVIKGSPRRIQLFALDKHFAPRSIHAPRARQPTTITWLTTNAMPSPSSCGKWLSRLYGTANWKRTKLKPKVVWRMNRWLKTTLPTNGGHRLSHDHKMPAVNYDFNPNILALPKSRLAVSSSPELRAHVYSLNPC